MDLRKQLEKNNETYWRVRNRIKETRRKLETDRINKNRTRYATRLMIKSGGIKVGPCEKCGSEKVQVHHLDYNDPEKVMFLCAEHHREWHRDNK